MGVKTELNRMKIIVTTKVLNEDIEVSIIF